MFIIKGVFALIVIPVLISLYLSKVSKLEGTKQQVVKGYTVSSLYFWLLIVAVGGGVYSEIRTFQGTKPLPIAEKPLEFFLQRVFEKEINEYGASKDVPRWNEEKEPLLRKFDHAVYAWNTKDYDEARKALISLKIGRDQVGDLLRIPSFVVNNNLGCAFFKQQRNKQFKAYSHFAEAKKLVGQEKPYVNYIDENLNNLDKMVNNLD